MQWWLLFFYLWGTTPFITVCVGRTVGPATGAPQALTDRFKDGLLHQFTICHEFSGIVSCGSALL